MFLSWSLGLTKLFLLFVLAKGDAAYNELRTISYNIPGVYSSNWYMHKISVQRHRLEFIRGP